MAKYVPDVKTQRWVIISGGRIARPHSLSGPDKKPKEPVCPFCYGHEAMTPPEVMRIGAGDKEKPGWDIRVVPNKYPITDTHEVIIHSPDHEKGIHELSAGQTSKIIYAYRQRYRIFNPQGQVLIFCNHGFHAGASLKHPHSQLVVVPRQINLDALSIEPVNNVISDTDAFISYCPEFSQWPYEVWVTPKKTGKKFGDLEDNDIDPLANMLRDSLIKISKVLLNPEMSFKQANEPFVYNFYIYHGDNWFMRIIPRSVHRAGFELGTGLSVNVVDPAQAADNLKKIT